MASKALRFLLLALAATAADAAATAADIAASEQRPAPPRVVLQITVDQLRGDLLERGRARFGGGGFARILAEGAVFTDAHHGHANTETVVGHASLATGADPSAHGMIGNVWFERTTGALRYNFEDPHYEIVGRDAPSPYAVSAIRGRSPQALLAPTIADSIALAGSGRAKVFAISLKDRGAIPMAGRAGKALWWSQSSGEFVSSTYYYPRSTLPAWAARWNDRHPADAYDGATWDLLLPREGYEFADRDDQPWEVPAKGMGRTFPHRFDRSALADQFYPALAASPFADEILVDFALALVAGEDVGGDDVVDYLSVALSANDYVGHRFGPSSLESEDEFLRLDRQIARLLSAVEEAAGKGRVLVVLSSDHGVAEAPAEMRARGTKAEWLAMSEVDASDPVREAARALGVASLVQSDWPPYVYLDRKALASAGVSEERAAGALAQVLRNVPGIAHVFTRRQIEEAHRSGANAAGASGPLASVARNFSPDRSGDLAVIGKPYWQLAAEKGLEAKIATSHGTPWRYDTWVPLAFLGPGVAPARRDERAETIDAAPTIAALLAIAAPLRASGRALLGAGD